MADLLCISCGLPYLFAIALFFISAILRRQLEDNFGIEFSIIGSLVLAEPLFFLLNWLVSTKIGLLAGILGMIIGGIGYSYIFGSGGQGF
jgi:hypothetical protein